MNRQAGAGSAALGPSGRGGGGGGGGSCTVNVASPLQGDGSAGAPLVIPASAGASLLGPAVSGYMSGAQAGQVAGLDTMFRWYLNRIAEVQSLIPSVAVTRYEMAKYGFADFGGVTSASVSSNANQKGGAALIAAGTTTYMTQTMITAPKTGDYVVAFGFAMRVLTSPHVSWIGLIDIAQTGQAVIKVDTTQANFKLLLKGTGGSDQLIDSGVALDTNPHNMTIAAHGGQTFLLIDGALKITSPNNNNMTDTNVAAWCQNDGNGEINPICALYGYVDGLPA